MPQFAPGDTLYINHARSRNPLWSWSAGDTEMALPHQVWHKPAEGQAASLQPGRDYDAIAISSESITLDAGGQRVRATHGRESSATAGMSIGQVVEVRPLEPA